MSFFVACNDSSETSDEDQKPSNIHDSHCMYILNNMSALLLLIIIM